MYLLFRDAQMSEVELNNNFFLQFIILNISKIPATKMYNEVARP